MKLIKSKNCDVNYLAQVVNITSFQRHPDPEVKKLKIAQVNGYKVVVGIDSKPGWYVYFPTLSQINKDFLSFNNLFKNKELNSNTEKSGSFEDNCKVSAIKLRGQVSEGFLIEFELFNNWLLNYVHKEIDDPSFIEFDSIKDGNDEFQIVKKYVKGESNIRNSKEEKQEGIDKVILSQFRHHYDTVILKKCPNVIGPNDLLSITQKINGVSGVSAFVMCKKEKTWKDKIIDFINDKILKLKPIDYVDYDYLFSSKSKVLNRYSQVEPEKSVWYYAHEFIKPYLIPGMTIYYEVVGFMPSGKCIQKGYDYGCIPPTKNYKPALNFKVRPYRITLTNVNGQVHEFSAREVQQWCKANFLTPVYQYYYGYAKDLYPLIDPNDECFGQKFMENLANEEKFFMEQKDPTCRNNVYTEGVVIRKENMKSEAFKLKCFAFTKTEIVNDEENIEDNA